MDEGKSNGQSSRLPLRAIFGTIGTRYLIAVLNLALIFINAKALGVEGVGLVGLILASVSIAVMFSGILAGNTIVYFMNRYSIQAVFRPAYLWAGVGSGVACGVMSVAGLVPEGYLMDVYLLATLTSLVTANSRFLLGREQIKAFNLTFMLQGGLLFFVILYFYYVAARPDLHSYLWAMYITNGIAFVVSFALLLPFLRQRGESAGKDPSFQILLKEMLVYGLWSSADNIAEILTTRLNYFLIRHFGGLGSVGLLDAGTKMSESVWHINRSIGFIEYSQVAQTRNPAMQKKITLQYLKLTFFAVTLATSCILLIPEWVYTDYLFSAEFTGMRKVIVGLSVGIVAMGCNSILSQYFIGSGKIRYSAACSFVGLASLLLAGYGLTPLYGIVGSAVSTSIAFCAMLAFSLIVFCKQTRTGPQELLLNRDDVAFILSRFKRS